MQPIKTFTKELYNENDGIAKSCALDFLLSTGEYKPIYTTDELYSLCDFIIHNKNDDPIKVEVERKLVWKKSGQWQGWPTIDVPYRKRKSSADIFIMVNERCDTLATTPMENVLNASVSEKDNRLRKAEIFFNVKLNKFKFFHKKEGKWVEVEPF